MLKYVPYDVIKKDEQAYAIMLLRDQNNNTFSDIAKEFKLTASTVTQTYNRLKLKQTMLYINQISVVLEQENNSQIRNIFEQAYECYHDRTYACAYLEIKYKDILSAYRNGEPGMQSQFINNIPPFKLKISKKTIERIVVMREIEKISFKEIAQTMHITSAKAEYLYYEYYRRKVLEI